MLRQSKCKIRHFEKSLEVVYCVGVWIGDTISWKEKTETHENGKHCSVFSPSLLDTSKVPDRLQTLGLAVEKTEAMDCWEAAHMQQFSRYAVFHWTSGADQDVELAITKFHVTMFAPCPFTKPGGDCLYCTQSVLSEERPLQDISRSEQQNLHWLRSIDTTHRKQRN